MTEFNVSGDLLRFAEAFKGALTVEMYVYKESFQLLVYGILSTITHKPLGAPCGCSPGIEPL